MNFLLMVYFNGAQQRMAQLPADERDKIVEEFVAFFSSPAIRDGHQLQPPETATTVHERDGATHETLGPFANASRDPLGGYYLIDADSMDAATALAARVPVLRLGAAVEVRPVIER